LSPSKTAEHRQNSAFSHRRSQKYIRGEFKIFLGKKSRLRITWTFEEQDALNSESGVSCGSRYLEISAREIDSLNDLYVAQL